MNPWSHATGHRRETALELDKEINKTTAFYSTRELPPEAGKAQAMCHHLDMNTSYNMAEVHVHAKSRSLSRRSVTGTGAVLSRYVRRHGWNGTRHFIEKRQNPLETFLCINTHYYNVLLHFYPIQGAR